MDAAEILNSLIGLVIAVGVLYLVVKARKKDSGGSVGAGSGGGGGRPTDPPKKMQ